jgi:hypothetical protein
MLAAIAGVTRSVLWMRTKFYDIPNEGKLLLRQSGRIDPSLETRCDHYSRNKHRNRKNAPTDATPLRVSAGNINPDLLGG